MSPPQIVVIAGPNGAGKSTAAAYLVPETVAFVNADEIAKELTLEPGRNPEIEAGRIMLDRLEDLQRERVDFTVETTLASRSLAPRIVRLKEAGYEFQLLFFWLNNVELAVNRVADRVRSGGHNIPEETIRRRYKAGIHNFFYLYRPLADTWGLYDNSRRGQPEIIARRMPGGAEEVHQEELWKAIREEAGI